MIALGHLTLLDRSGVAWDRFVVDAQLTRHGHIALTLEQGIEPDEPWGSTDVLVPTISLSDLRVLRDLLSSVLCSAEACLDAVVRPRLASDSASPPARPEG